MTVAWPKGIEADNVPRLQFYHVVDIVPTIYKLTGIAPSCEVNGVPQDSFDGISLVYTFGDAKADDRRTTQFFDIMAGRGIYHDGRFIDAMGPPEPWVGGVPEGIKKWSLEKEMWELYNIRGGLESSR
ncbi:MAG: hypothetical protein R3B74_06235 [Nitrospirales bacterium]|nr:hypothetical protein [Nitrospirales bacterium]